LKDDLGRSKNRGCNNGRIFVSTKMPQYEINKDMWINPNALDTLYVRKTADTSRASTTTITDDPHLSITLPANGVFHISLFLTIIGAQAGDITVDFDLGGGLSALCSNRHATGPEQDMTNVYASLARMKNYPVEISNNYGTDPDNDTNIILWFLLQSAAAGNFTFKWAQRASNAIATVVKEESYLVARQLAGDVSLLKWYSEDDDEWKFII
jgi:hypothetical protein